MASSTTSSNSVGAGSDPTSSEQDAMTPSMPSPQSPRHSPRTDRRNSGQKASSSGSTGTRRPGMPRQPSKVPLPPQWNGPFAPGGSATHPISPDASPVNSSNGDVYTPTSQQSASRVFPVRSQIGASYAQNRRRRSDDEPALASPALSPPMPSSENDSAQGFSFTAGRKSTFSPDTSSANASLGSSEAPLDPEDATGLQSTVKSDSRRQATPTGPTSTTSRSDSASGGMPDDLQSVSDTDIIERARAARARGPQEQVPSTADTLYLTQRFEHQDTPEGHMILTGRAGDLTKCEDEPIHIPGAVQAFGVLIAIEENDYGNWQVVQASENSGHVLGLPPKHLFGLRCFTSVFDEDNADLLRDHLDNIRERDSQDLIESGPLTVELEGTGVVGVGLDGPLSDMHWQCWVTMHLPSADARPNLVVLEFEIMDDSINPIATESAEPLTEEERTGLAGEPYQPTADDLYQSTTSMVKPLRSLARFRQSGKSRGNGSMDIFRILGQVNEQLNRAADLHSFLKITVGVMRELTGFHRVMIYQFDEIWAGQVVAELVDWTKTRDLYRGLHFPASDIPAQARELYKLNRVRSLYDRDQPTARLVCRNADELDKPINMTHCSLRAMSPIHIKYLANMGVRASMSVSIIAFNSLWGLISCHSYGRYGMRVSCPVRQMCRILGDSISRNIERLSYAQRLQSRKLINTAPTSANPSGYIVAKAEDLLSLFDAEFGVLSVGEEAKLLGPVDNSQEALAILEYLRMKSFTTIKVSQDVANDFPDIGYAPGFQDVAGLLSIPLSSSGRDFIVFFRRGQVKHIHWAGNPYDKILKEGTNAVLEPRKSFRLWSETVLGKSKAWTDEQLETASVLCLVYGKFIDVWRQKQSALRSNQLTTLLLSNASHEVRTPLNAIVNYLEMALDGPLDETTRDQLSKSYNASRSLIHVINDLLDLTRAEEGNELALNDPFELEPTIEEAIDVHRDHARTKGLEFEVVETPLGTPSTVLGDRAKLRLVIGNIVTNAVRHTSQGKVTVEWGEMQDPTAVEVQEELRQDRIMVCISIIDTGVGIPTAKLDSMFREFEQVESSVAADAEERLRGGLGLGLAVVARIVRNLGGVLKADSVVGQGSRFTVVLPLRLPSDDTASSVGSGSASMTSLARHGSIESSRSGSVTTTPLPTGGGSASTTLQRRGSSGSVGSAGSGGSGSIGRGSAGSLGSLGSRGSQRSELDELVHAMSSSPSIASSKQLAGSHVTSSNSPRRVQHRDPKRPVLFSGAERSHRPENGQGVVELEGTNTPLRAVRVDEHGNEVPVTPAPNALANAAGMPGGFPFPTPPLTPSTGPVVPTSSSTWSPVASTSSSSGQRRRQTSGKGGAEISLRVLVVEDDPINRAIIQKKLSKDGHTITIAEHGEIGVKTFETAQRAFDVVLMDLQMPICDGYTASRRIRELEQKKPYNFNGLPYSHQLNGRIPILAVSASLPEKQREELEDAGFDGWTLKPLNWAGVAKLLQGVTHIGERDMYRPGRWERGGWLRAGNPTHD